MHTEVAVVGAGPAGAWAAYQLARGGARVAIFDGSHPREKPCGGGVTGRALGLVAGAVPLDRLSAVHIKTARFLDQTAGVSAPVALANGAESHDRTSRRFTQPLIIVSRQQFDGVLLSTARSAGATLVPCRVMDVTREKDGFRLHTVNRQTHAARWLIGADGVNSLVRRRLAAPFRRDQLSIATGFFSDGVTSDEIVIEMVAEPPGYIWSFPRPDHLAIGICAQADAGTSAASLRRLTAKWIAQTSIGVDGRLRAYSWPIPSLDARDYESLDLARDGCFLIGDAAGLVDPITREGIYFALNSAGHAATAVTTGREPEREYRERVLDEIAGELARAARLKAGFFRPPFARLLMNALARSAAIRRILADLIAGTQGYRGLEWRLARTMEIGLAWEFLRLRKRQ